MLLQICLSIGIAFSFPVLVAANVGGCVDFNSVCKGESFAECKHNEMFRQSCPCLCRIPPSEAVESTESKNYLKKCCQAKGMTPSCQGLCNQKTVRNLSIQQLIKYNPFCTPPNDGNIWLQCASTNRDIESCCKTDSGHGRAWDEPYCREICQGRHPGRKEAVMCFFSKFDAVKSCLLDWDGDNDA